MSIARTIRHLEQVFDDERHYLLQGDLGRLGRLAERKESLLMQLKSQDVPKKTLARLSTLSDRNQGLIKAAQDGLQSVRDRLSELQRGASIGTYSRSGEKSMIAKPVRTLQRRA